MNRLAALRDRGWSILLVYWGWLIVPVLLASLARPFALWDYLTAPDILHGGGTIAWGNLAAHYWHGLINHRYFIRPTFVLLYDLQALVFGGEFWLWYLLKWTAKAAAVALACVLVRRAGTPSLATWATAAFLLFHVCGFQTMLISLDGWVALGVLGILVLLTPPGKRWFDLNELSPRLLLAVLAIFWFTVGTKEVAHAFAAVLVPLLTLRSGPRAWLPLLILWSIEGFYGWRLYEARDRASGLTVEAFARAFYGHLLVLVPHSPFRLFKLLVGSLWLWAGWIAFKERHSQTGLLLAFTIAAAGAMLAFTSTTSAPAPRYVIPSLYLLSIPLGIALSRVPARLARPACFLLIAAYPLFTAGDIYRQELGYQRNLYHAADSLALLELRATEGYVPVLSQIDPDLALENQLTVSRFFEKYGPVYYNRPGLPVRKLGNWPQVAYVHLSGNPPDRVRHSGLPPVDESRLERVETLTQESTGLITALSAFYDRLDRVLLNAHWPYYDGGAPYAEPDYRLYLYSYRAAGTRPAPRPAAAKVGVFRAGEWLLDSNGNGRFDQSGDITARFGDPGDIPIAGDWTGLGRDSLGVFRDGVWRLDLNGNRHWDGEPADRLCRFGQPGDLPLAWKHEGRSQIAVFRNGDWFLDLDGDCRWDPARDRHVRFGASGDKPFLKASTPCLIGKTSTCNDGTATPSAIPGDHLVLADWEGDGVLRSGSFSAGEWVLDGNGNGKQDSRDVRLRFGQPGDLPITGAWPEPSPHTVIEVPAPRRYGAIFR